MTQRKTHQNEPKATANVVTLYPSTDRQMPVTGLASSAVADETKGKTIVASLKAPPNKIRTPKKSISEILRQLDRIPRPTPNCVIEPSTVRNPATQEFVRNHPNLVQLIRDVEGLPGVGGGSSHTQEPTRPEAKVASGDVIGDTKTTIGTAAVSCPENPWALLYHDMAKFWLSLMARLMGCQK